MPHLSTPALSRHLFIIRHGRSIQNEAFTALHASDGSHFTPTFLATPEHVYPLSQSGVEQIFRAGAYIKKRILPRHSFDKVFVSHYTRARQTLQHLALQPSLRSWWFAEAQEIAELSWGDMVRVHPNEVREVHASFYKDFAVDPWHTIRPGGESYACVSRRLDTFCDRLVTEHRDDTVFAVSHGNTMETLFARRSRMQPEIFNTWLHSAEPVTERIQNGDVHHYAHVNPETGQYDPSHLWYREIHAARAQQAITPWQNLY
jgi:broad specificity phosphatase PhoE